MTDRNPVPSERSADRLEIVNLIDAWARCADRRKNKAALFAADGRITVQMADPSNSEPVQTLQGHAELAEAFKVLETYDATTHFNGQSTITLDDDHATGESYCLAHHIWVEDGPSPAHDHGHPLSRHLHPPGRRMAVRPPRAHHRLD
jgi:hypothetical protein